MKAVFAHDVITNCIIGPEQVAKFKAEATRQEIRDPETGVVGVFYLKANGHILCDEMRPAKRPAPSFDEKWIEAAAMEYVGDPAVFEDAEDRMYRQCDLDELATIIRKHAKPAHPSPSWATEAAREGIEAAAKLLDKKADAYAEDHGSYDHDTGMTEFSRAGEDYYNTLRELAEEIRTLKTK